METLGIRNCNPGNIRCGSAWKGLIGSEKGFCRFDSMAFGVRALLVVLRTYHYKYRLDTIRSIVNRFAPASDGNDTGAYIRFVEQQVWDYYKKEKRLFDTQISVDLHHQELCHYPFNRWFNKKQPFAALYPICFSICWIESRYYLDYETYVDAVNLL